MNPKELYEKIRLLAWIIIQDVMFFLIHKILQCILYCRDHFYYFPLKNVDEKYPCALEQQSSISVEDHYTAKENPKINTNHPIPEHIPVPHKVPDRYKPLILPPTLNAFPNDYPKYLPRFDGENGVTAQKHIQAFEDYLNLFEVDDEDVANRIFALSLQGKVRTWFKSLPEASISNLEQFLKLFLDRWIFKVNLLMLIEEYNQLKRGRGLYNGEGLYNGGGLLGRCPELFWMEAVEKATEQSWLFFTWSARGRRVKI